MRPSDRPGGLSRAAARVATSRFAKPAARVALVVTGLFLLAFIGRSTVAGAGAASSPAEPTVALAFARPAAIGATAPEPPAPATSSLAPLPLVAAAAPAAPAAPVPLEAGSVLSASSARASPEDPVALNTATVDDLRRLPGIGPKRADAIVALRSRLGRFRAIEDLLKVKGIGRATLRRLRPLVRLDAPAIASPRDGGSGPPVPATGPPLPAAWSPPP
jgi:competence protein ComEA